MVRQVVTSSKWWGQVGQMQTVSYLHAFGISSSCRTVSEAWKPVFIKIDMEVLMIDLERDLWTGFLSGFYGAWHAYWVHSQAPPFGPIEGQKWFFPVFLPIRVSEEPVCIYLFRQNPFFASLHLRSPVHVVPPLVDIQRQGFILAWIVILFVYGAQTQLQLISPFLRWSLDLWNKLLGF